MERINYNSLKFFEYLDKLSPKNSGIIFSFLFHFIILIFVVGLPNFFGSKNIYVPNIVPIEILNISETTNTQKTETKNQINKQTKPKQKKFNSSDNTEVQKNYELTENIKTIDNNDSSVEIKQKTNVQIQQKKTNKMDQKQIVQDKSKIETVKTDKIKPKIKPKSIKPKTSIKTSDVQIDQTSKKDNKPNNKEVVTKPKPKPEEDFSIASMLKDLRNEKSNNVINEDTDQAEIEEIGQEDKNDNMILSISEIDLLRQQLSSCWNAPAGAVIERGMKVTISAKVQQNMRVFENSVRIVDTNISKSNTFYGPITESAMRTLLNPECTPLKLPKDKYNLWKNLTITFDYSIMKGF